MAFDWWFDLHLSSHKAIWVKPVLVFLYLSTNAFAKGHCSENFPFQNQSVWNVDYVPKPWTSTMDWHSSVCTDHKILNDEEPIMKMCIQQSDRWFPEFHEISMGETHSFKSFCFREIVAAFFPPPKVSQLRKKCTLAFLFSFRDRLRSTGCQGN